MRTDFGTFFANLRLAGLYKGRGVKDIISRAMDIVEVMCGGRVYECNVENYLGKCKNVVREGPNSPWVSGRHVARSHGMSDKEVRVWDTKFTVVGQDECVSLSDFAGRKPAKRRRVLPSTPEGREEEEVLPFTNYCCETFASFPEVNEYVLEACGHAHNGHCARSIVLFEMCTCGKQMSSDDVFKLAGEDSVLLESLLEYNGTCDGQGTGMWDSDEWLEDLFENQEASDQAAADALLGMCDAESAGASDNAAANALLGMCDDDAEYTANSTWRPQSS